MTLQGRLYAGEERGRGRPEVYSQTEDVVLKVAAEFFGDVLLPHVEIHEKPEGIPPTEMVHPKTSSLNLRRGLTPIR